MPNFTGVTRQRPLGVRVRGVERRDLGEPRGDVGRWSSTWSQASAGALGVPHRLAVRRGLAVDVEVAAAQVDRVDPEQRRAAAEDVLDHEHPLRPAEPAERGLRGLVGLRDPAVHPDVRDPVGVVDVAQRPGQHRLGQVEAPAAVGGERGVERLQPAVVVEADPPLGVEAVPLAGHRHVLRAGQPQPHRAAGERRAERRDRGEPVRLHLLAAEAAAHPQALHGDLVAVQAEHVGDDLLRLGRVLGAALHEDLAALVDQRQRAVGLEVEVLLAGDLGDSPLKTCADAGQPGLDVAALDGRLAALEAVGRDRLVHRDQRRQRLVVDLDRQRRRAGRPRASRRAPSRRRGRGTSPRSGNSGSSCLTPASLTPGTSSAVSTRTTPGTSYAGAGVEPGDPGVGVRRLDRVGVQDVVGAARPGRRCRAPRR